MQKLSTHQNAPGRGQWLIIRKIIGEALFVLPVDARHDLQFGSLPTLTAVIKLDEFLRNPGLVPHNGSCGIR
jgi:hypothetical protein